MSNLASMDNEIFFQGVKGLLDEGHDVTIKVVGRSMEPFFRSHKDEIRLSPIPSGFWDEAETDGGVWTWKKKRGAVGSFVLARIQPDGKYVAHRIVAIHDGMIIMRGDGNVFGTEKAYFDDVLAFVTAYRRGRGRQFHELAGSRLWRIYSRAWMRTGHLPRRVLLALWHHVVCPMSPSLGSAKENVKANDAGHNLNDK